MGEAEMQHRETAHRDANGMRFADLQFVEHGADVVAGAILRIARRIFRHLRGRVAAGVVGDAAIAPPEIAHLAFVTAIVVGEFVDENDRRSRAGFLVIEADAVIGRQLWHRCPLFWSTRVSYGWPRACGKRRWAAQLAWILSVSSSGPGLCRARRRRSGPGSPDLVRTSFPDQL